MSRNYPFEKIFICLIFALLTAGCDSGPTKVEKLKNKYLVYLSPMARMPSTVVYNFEIRGAKVQPLMMPYDAGSVSVSAEGKYLFFDRRGLKPVLVIDAMSLDSVASLPSAGQVIVSPKNDYVGVVGKDSTHVFRLPDFALIGGLHVGTETDHGVAGIFSPDGLLWIVNNHSNFVFGEYSELVAVACENSGLRIVDTITTRRFTLVSDIEADSAFLYLYTSIVWPNEIVRVDRKTGEQSVLKQLSSGNGTIALSSDSKYLAYSQPRDIFLYPPSPRDSQAVSEIAVIELSSMREFTVSTKGITKVPKEAHYPEFSVWTVAFTPDGRYLLAVENLLGKEVAVFEVGSWKLADYEFFPSAVCRISIPAIIRD